MTERADVSRPMPPELMAGELMAGKPTAGESNRDAVLDDLVLLVEVRPGGSTPRYRCVAANEAWCRLFSPSGRAVVGHAPEEILAPLLAGQLLEQCDDVLRSERPVRYRVDTLIDDRHVRLETALEPIVDAAGVCTHLLAVARDLDALRLSMLGGDTDANFRALATAAPIGIFIRELDSAKVFANDRLLEIAGATGSSGRADDWMSLLHPDDAARVALLREDLIAHGGDRDIEFRICRRDGEIRELRARVSVTESPEGTRSVVGSVEDVTDRKATEREAAHLAERLASSQAWYRSLVLNATDLISVWRPDGVSYVSPSVESVLGWTPAELAAIDVSCLLDPDDAPLVARVMEELAEHPNATMPVEYRFRHADGSWRWIASRTTNLLDDPVVQGMVTNSHDITERREAEEARARSEAALRAIVQSSPLPIYALDRSGNVQLWSRACEELFGWSEGEVIGRRVPFVAEDQIPQFEALLEAAFGGETVRGQEVARRCKDGSIVDVSISAAPIHDSAGRVAMVMSVIADVTDRRRAEQALRASEERFRSLTENSSELVCVVDGMGTIQYLSPSSARFLGVSLDDALGRPLQGLTHPDDAIRTRAIAGMLSKLEGSSKPFEMRIRTESGEWRWVEAIATGLLHDPNVAGIVINARDITERRESDEAVREINEALRQSNETLSAIVEHSPLAIAAFSLDGRIELWNPAAERLFGWTAVDVLGRVPPFVHSADVDEVNQLASRVFAGEVVHDLEAVRLHRDGHEIITRFSTAPMRDGDGRIIAAIAVMVDVTAQQAALAALHDSEARFRALVQNSSDIVAVVEADGSMRYLSPSVERILGYRPEDLAGRSPFELIHPDDLDAIVFMFDRAVAGIGIADWIEVRFLHADGTWRNIETQSSNLFDDPAIGGFVVTGRDVTEQYNARNLIASQARILELIATGASLHDALAEICRVAEERVPGARGSILLVSDDGASLRMGAAPSLPGTLLEQLDESAVGPDSGPYGAAAFRSERIFVADVSSDLVAATGREMFAAHDVRSLWVIPVRASGTGPIIGTVGLHFSEPTEPNNATAAILDFIVHLAAIAIERKTFESRLAHQAHHDPLTSLPNRLLFFEFLTLALARSRRHHTNVAVLFIDLDRFKGVNDSMGHDQGDNLLRQVALRLQSVVRPGDTVSRFGGDEFTILCEDLSAPDAKSQVVDVAERLLDVLQRPFDLAGDEVFLSASIGIALAGGAGERAEALLRDADAAMYRAKERGKGRWELFDEAMRANARQRLDTENALHRALDRREFKVFYQPVISLSEGRCTGVEALVRWQHSERGLIGPQEFIHLAEETGLIIPIGNWVLDEVCRQIASWQVLGSADDEFVVSVNLSARQLAQSDLIESVTRALERSGANPARLCLEITESVLMDDAETTMEALRSLRTLGVGLSIDDFGTGYSSLGYLKRFPVDSVKIDRSFVDGLGTDPEDSAIVAAVVSLGHALGLRVVAEGVETREQIRELVALGCDDAQGFFFASPQPASGLDDVVTGVRTFG